MSNRKVRNLKSSSSYKIIQHLHEHDRGARLLRD
jgi:hypothetical protein